MLEILIGVLIVLNIAFLILILQIYRKSDSSSITEFSSAVSDKLNERTDKLTKDIRAEFSENRDRADKSAREQREELNKSVQNLSKQLTDVLQKMAQNQNSQFDSFSDQLFKLTKSNEEQVEKLQGKVETQLKEMQEKNEKKLEEMRVTVDEKLHDTLEKRLGESFKIVSERLEQVYKGLGDMQELARGVGDLKNVLTNVKTRGTWGEVQLENIIEQILNAEQYDKNVSTKRGSADRVEIAIKLPGRSDSPDEVVYLPIDAKFPIEDYQRLQEARDTADVASTAEASKAIERRIKIEAKKISDKYVDPPNTTDFAIMFLPVEGLYAEVLRNPGLADFLQREFRITIAGPTTLAALLNSLQMGFRTLAIEKRSSEVWKILSGVKTEFGKFGSVLDKTKKKLQEATNTIDDAAVRTRAIERKLKDVQELPSGEVSELVRKE